MPLVRVSSLDDPQLSDYRIVREPALIRERGLFVAEGRLVVERLLGLSRYDVQSLLVTDAAWAALGPRLTATVRFPVYVVSAAVLAETTGYAVHRGCLALARLPRDRPLSDVLSGAAPVVVLESIANADNVGGVFRNAAAFGARVLLSRSCCSPYYRKAIRTSMGAVLAVPFAWLDEWPAGLDDVRRAGYTLVALTPRQPAVTLDAFATSCLATASSMPVALIVGNEGLGLSGTVESTADVRVRIPIADGVDSLNVVVATGIALARLTSTV